MTGVDASPQTLELARRRTEGRDNVELHLADATGLPVPDGAFDAALSVQVLEYVPTWTPPWPSCTGRCGGQPPGHLGRRLVDRVLALHRPRPYGPGPAAWDGHLADPSPPRTLEARLRAAGFTGVDAEGHTFATTELTPTPTGRPSSPWSSGTSPAATASPKTRPPPGRPSWASWEAG